MKNIGNTLPKVDARANMLGGAVYVEDYPRLPGTLIVKALRSPYAHAYIRSIDTRIACKVPGVAAIFTYEDAPDIRYSANGCTYPESCPYDRKILDRTVRYVGDEVALVAAETEAAAARALRLIRVQYDVLPAVLDPEESATGNVVIHNEDDIFVPAPAAGYDPKHNQISCFQINIGDVDRELADSEVVYSAVYKTQAQAHAMMETLRSYTFFAPDGRLTVVASTQAPYHLRRQVARCVGLPIGRVRVIKMRVGGGFGGKKVAIADPLAAFVTVKTGRPALVILDRKENFAATTTRHAMEMRVSLGADRDGTLRAIKIENMSNTGAYGEEGPPVTMVVANNILPSYNRARAIYYNGRTIYTNMVAGGALRGYGATQGGFALESAMSELADKLGMSPYDLRMKNMARLGDVGGVLHSEIKSCALDKCMERGREMIGWDEKYPRKVLPNGHIRAVGVALTTHRTSIPVADKATVTLRLEPDGSFLVLTGAADLGTGADTVLTQIAAEALHTTARQVCVRSGDTDYGTYDSGAFASSTTYVAGNAILKAAEELTQKICRQGAALLNCSTEEVAYDGGVYVKAEPERRVSIEAIGTKAEGGGTQQILSTATYISGLAPLTFMSGFAEIDLDPETGKLQLLRFVSVADCGKVLNPALARVQAEGGVLMGIVVVFGILSVLCSTLLAGTPLASTLQQLGGGAGATAANVALDASGIKGKIDSELRSHAGDIAAATGLSEGQVEDIINQIDISSWSVTTLPADATVAGSFQTSYQGTNVTVTTYTDPSYVSISPWGQTITLAVPESSQNYVSYLSYL